MARYRVQGPNGEIIEIEGPDGADPADVIAQARTLYRAPEKTATDYAKDFGKATASLADTALNAVTGTLDYAAYPLARAFGRTSEQATAETTSPKDVIGRAFGITQDPAYRGEASRRLMGGISEGVEQYAVKPIVTATGLPETDVANMVNTGMLGAGVRAQPYINRAAQSAAQTVYAAEPLIAEAVKAPVKYPYQFARGAVEGVLNKEYNPATSAMAALQDTYIPPAAAQRFMGNMPGVPPQTLSQLESQARPTSELVGSTAGRIAQAVSPKTASGQTLVPLQGQGMQAFGERVGRGIRTNPLQAMGEVGLTALTGIPFKTLAQGAGELGARYLGSRTGFAPGFESQVGAAQAQAALQPNVPRLPAPGPVAPGPIYAGAGGASADLSAAGQAALNAKYPPMPPVEAPPPQTSQTLFEAARAAAAARITPPKTPEQQAILDQIRARAAQAEADKAQRVAALQQRAQAAGGYTPPQVQTPVAGPVVPATTLDQLRSRLTPQTPEQIADVEAYNALSPAEKARQTRAENSARKVAPVVPEPIAETPAPTVQSTMTTTEKPITFDELAADVVGAKEFGIIHDIKNKTRTEPNPDLPTLYMPKNLKDALPKKVEWEKSVEQWLPDGSDIAYTEYYTKATKNSPAYKYVEPEIGDPVLYKKEPGGSWQEVQTTPNQTPSKKAPPGVSNMIVPEGGGTKSLANQVEGNYKYIGDGEKMPDGSTHYGNAHYHGSQTNPLKPAEVQGRRALNELKDKGSEQTYWVKQGDTLKQIYSDGPDLTITVYDSKTGKSFEYKRSESYDGKTEYSTSEYDKNGTEISHTRRQPTANLSQWPKEFSQDYF